MGWLGLPDLPPARADGFEDGRGFPLGGSGGWKWWEVGGWWKPFPPGFKNPSQRPCPRLHSVSKIWINNSADPSLPPRLKVHKGGANHNKPFHPTCPTTLTPAPPPHPPSRSPHSPIGHRTDTAGLDRSVFFACC